MRKLILLFAAWACLSMPCANADTITDARVIDANFFSAVVTLGRGGSGVAPIGACNMGVFADDGCGSAPAPLTASFARTNVLAPGGYLNTTAGTTANYTATNCGISGSLPCHQPFNQAGNGDQGYHIGFVTPLGNSSTGVACTPATVASGACMPTCTKTAATFDGTCLLDPALIAVTGCTPVNGTGAAGSGGPATGNPTVTHTGGRQLSCGTGFAGTLQHFNLGPVNGHDCTQLLITTSGLSGGLLDDFYFQNNSGNCASLGQAIAVSTTSSGLMTVSDFEADGGWDNFGDTIGSASCVTANVTCNPAIFLSIGAFPVLVEYGAMYHFAVNMISTSGGATTLKYNWIEGWCLRGASCHAEWYDGQQGGNSRFSQIFDHNTILGTTIQSGFSPGQVLLTANYGFTAPVITFNDETVINQFTGGISAPNTVVAGCLGMPPSSGTALTPVCSAGSGPIFYQTSTTPNVVGQGVLINNNCSGSGGGVLYKFIPGPYTNAGGAPPIQAEFYIDSFSPSAVPGVGGYAAGTLAGTPPGGTFTIASASCIASIVNTFGTITGGSGYANGTFLATPLTDVTGSGSGARANITVAGGAVTAVTLTAGGTGYSVGDILSSSGTGTGFSVPVATLTGTVVSAAQGNSAMFTNGPGHGPTPVDQITVTNNLSDFSSGVGINTYVMQGGTPAAFFASINGTDMLGVANVNVTHGQFVFSSSIPDCSTSLLLCPTVSSVSGSYPSGTATGVTLTSGSGPSINLAATGVTLFTPTAITSGTITGLNALSTNGQTVTLATGDTIYDIANGTCSGVAPTTCPKVATGGTGTSFPLTGATANTTAVAMTNLHQTSTPTVTINNASPSAIAAGAIMLGTTNSSTIHFGGSPGIGPFILTAACSAGPITSCPQVSSPFNAGVTSYVLASSGGTVGGVNSFVAVTAHNPTTCTNPAIISGNFDMANIISPSPGGLLNPNWTTTPQFDQAGC